MKKLVIMTTPVKKAIKSGTLFKLITPSSLIDRGWYLDDVELRALYDFSYEEARELKEISHETVGMKKMAAVHYICKKYRV